MSPLSLSRRRNNGRSSRPAAERHALCVLALEALQAARPEAPFKEPTELQVQAGAVILATTPLIDAPKQLSHNEWMGLSRQILEAAFTVSPPRESGNG